MAAKVALGTLGYTLTALLLSDQISMRTRTTYPSDQDVLGERGVWVLDFDECELNASVRELIDQIGKFALAGSLNLQNTLFAAILLEGADERGSDGEDGPLAKGGRARLGTFGRRRIDDVFVAPLYVWAVARRVERSHDERGGCVELCLGSRLGRGGEDDDDMLENAGNCRVSSLS